MKKALKFIWNEFVHSGHVFSIGAVCIVLSSALLLEIDVSLSCLLVIYLGIQSTYLYNRYKELRLDESTNIDRTVHLKKYSKIVPYIIIVQFLLILFVLVLAQKTSTLLFSFLLVLIGLSYTILFKKITKFLIGFKNVFVAFAWTLLPLFLIYYYDYSINLRFLIITFFVFLRILIHEILSDTKDLQSDKKENLRTLPLVLNKKQLFYLINFFNIISVLLILLGIYIKLLPLYSIFLALLFFYTLFCQKKINDVNSNKDMLYNMIIDGEYVFWVLLLFIGRVGLQ